MRIDYKPISVNDCWQGKRFKTDKYKIFERDLLWLLPNMTLPEAPYSIILTFGVSNLASDIDNPCKPFIDVLQKRYNFNDKDIMQMHVYKRKTEKGKEFINFTIEHCIV